MQLVQTVKEQEPQDAPYMLEQVGQATPFRTLSKPQVRQPAALQVAQSVGQAMQVLPLRYSDPVHV